MSAEITPQDGAAARMLESDDGGPIVMVNLLKFRPGGGSKEYGRYGMAFAQLLHAAGGKFIYTGRVAETLVGDDDWHAVAVVEYPSRQVFREVTSSPEYEAIHPYREAGLEKTLLYATTPVTM